MSAYLNALSEQKDPDVLFAQITFLHTQLAEARTVAEMVILDVAEEGELSRIWGDDGEILEPDEFCRRRLLELRQNVQTVEFKSVADWDAKLETQA